jgi:AcrR family transcriptional regulator
VNRKPADQRKAEIAAAALRLADELGPDRLTTQAIADAVGVTQAAIFRHFPTKQALWRAVADALAETLVGAWQGALDGQAAPEQRLVALIRAQLRLIEANPAIPAILHSRELQTENAELRQRFLQLMTRFQGLLSSELRIAQAAGTVRADIAPDDCAVLMISLVQGLAIRWSLGSRTFGLEAEGVRLLGEQLRSFGVPTVQEVAT